MAVEVTRVSWATGDHLGASVLLGDPLWWTSCWFPSTPKPTNQGVASKNEKPKGSLQKRVMLSHPEVRLPSGRSASLRLSCDATVRELKLEAQRRLKRRFLKLTAPRTLGRAGPCRPVCAGWVSGSKGCKGGRGRESGGGGLDSILYNWVGLADFYWFKGKARKQASHLCPQVAPNGNGDGVKCFKF